MPMLLFDSSFLRLNHFHSVTQGGDGGGEVGRCSDWEGSDPVTGKAVEVQ